MLFVILAIVFLLLVLCWWIYTHPSLILTPINSVLTLDSSPRPTFYLDDELLTVFPAAAKLRASWMDIRAEGWKLFETYQPEHYFNNYHVDVGNEDMKDWTVIPVKLFDNTHPEYRLHTPVLSQIIDECPQIRSAIFSIMEPGKIIQPHSDPYDGTLRYQLALDIPEGDCYLHVNKEKYFWVEGHDVIFNDALEHGAVNNTDSRRMVLLIDIARPYDQPVFKLLNETVLKILSVV